MQRLLLALVCLIMASGCSDEKTVAVDPADIRTKKTVRRSISKRPEKTEASGSITPPAKQSHKNEKKAVSKKPSGSRADIKARKQELPSKKQHQKEVSKNVPDGQSKEKKEPTIANKQAELRLLFRHSQPVFRAMTESPKNHRLSWKTLSNMIEKTGAQKKISVTQRQHALQWIAYLERNSKQLKNVFRHPFSWESPQNSRSLNYVRHGNALLTPALNSMWRHCKLNFEDRMPGWQIRLISGYRSPAFEAFLMTQSSGTLDDVLHGFAPPNYNRHQRAIPDITVELVGKKGETGTARQWKELHQICRPFGFTQGDVQERDQKGELEFVGVERLYQSTFFSKLIPETTKKNFFNAMQRTGFYPSPEGMRILFAISAQESSVSWNPRLNETKKEDLKKKFNRILMNIENAFGGTVSELFFSATLNQEKIKLIAELRRITNLRNRQIREYDFYLWTKKVRRFLSQLLKENRKLTRFGQWLFKIEQFADQIQYEPQTFGLWQINVNHLIERIESYRQLRRRFPELYTKSGEKWKVNRSRLVDVLSGMRSSVLDRQRTLELIIYTYLQPRYKSHLLGHKDDLMFFIAENVAGEMSTYRAAIQQELNNRIGSRLIPDGDLSFYHPYSTRIDWTRPSNTQKAFQKFIQKRYAYFSRPVDMKKLVKTLCEVKTWEKMQKDELYRRIMRKNRGQRDFPQITSKLYQQTPLSYARIVLKKSQLF